jgi:hypothetical protein
MAGRPRLYANAAEKTRAYRQRQAQRSVSMDRVTLEQIEAALERLMTAVLAAQQSGDPLAGSLSTVSRLDLLAELAAYFETHGSQNRPESR